MNPEPEMNFLSQVPERIYCEPSILTVSENCMLTSSLALSTRELGLPFKKALLRVPQLGGRGVMIDARHEITARDFSESAQRELLRYLKELDLKISALCFPTRHDLADQRSLDERVNALLNAMKLASQLKVRTLLIEMGTVPEPILESDSEQEESTPTDSSVEDLLSPANLFQFQIKPEQPYDQYQVLLEVMQDLARVGNKLGVTVTITPTGPLPRLQEFLAKIKSGPVGINFDPSLCILEKQDPQEVVRCFHDRLMHVVARDRVQERNGQSQEVPIGQGEVSWEEVLALLTEADYRGWLTVQRTTGDQIAADLAGGIQFLQNVAMV